MKKNGIVEELSKFAKLIAPDVVRTKIVQRDRILSLRLKWKNYPQTIESQHIIWWNYTDKDLDHKDYHAITNSVRKNIDNAISKFGRNQCDFIIDKFGLYEALKDAFEDKNVMYKVKHDYDRKIGGAIAIRNLSFYYFDEIKISIPHLFHFWILLLKDRFKHSKKDEILDITYYIIERIKQLFFTYGIIEDTIKEAKHYGNPDTFFVFYFHFSYFVSVVKTIGDNLAWILKLYLDLNVPRVHVDLNDEKFKSSLGSNPHYYNLLYSNDYYDEFKILTSFRNIIQHRHVIRGIRVVTSEDRKNKVMIPKNPEVFLENNKKIVVESVDSMIHDGLHEYYFPTNDELLNDYGDPLVFCRKHLEGISLVINRTIGRMAIEATRILIGEVTKFYPKNSVAVIDVFNELKMADELLIEGATTSIQQQNTSMEMHHNKVKKCDNGLVGIRVNGKVRAKDKVYRITKIDRNTFLQYI